MIKTIFPAVFAVFLPFAVAAQDQVPGEHFVENWDLDSDGQVTLAEATEKRGDIFIMFDQDENGLLDAEEYTLFDETRQADMQANAGGHQRGLMKYVNQGMIREFNDADGDGLVSEEEFMARVPDWFEMMDRNDDDLVTTDDFARGQGRG